MEEYVYSPYKDCENWQYESEEEALEESFGNGLMALGGTAEVVVYRGTKVPLDASSYVPDVYDSTLDSLYNEIPSEYDWGIPVEKQQELQGLVENVVQNFLKVNNLEPNFYYVKNVTPLTFKVRCTEDDWEILPTNTGDNT